MSSKNKNINSMIHPFFRHRRRRTITYYIMQTCNRSTRAAHAPYNITRVLPVHDLFHLPVRGSGHDDAYMAI